MHETISASWKKVLSEQFYCTKLNLHRKLDKLTEEMVNKAKLSLCLVHMHAKEKVNLCPIASVRASSLSSTVRLHHHLSRVEMF